MQISSSANRTCSACSSSSEYTATVLMPSSRHAWMTRSAISPRLAIRIFLNILREPPRLLRADGEERLAEFHWLGVLWVNLYDDAVGVALDFVHQLHRLDDAQHLPLAHAVAGPRVGVGVRAGRGVESA